MQTTPPIDDLIEHKSLERKRAYAASEIDQMNFQIKTEDDPIGSNGII